MQKATETIEANNDTLIVSIFSFITPGRNAGRRKPEVCDSRGIILWKGVACNGQNPAKMHWRDRQIVHEIEA